MTRSAVVLIVALMATGLALGEEHDFEGPYAGLSLGLAQGTYTSTEYSGNWDYGEYSATSNLEPSFGIHGGYNFPVSDAGIVGVELSIAMPGLDEERVFDGGDYINRAEWNHVISLRVRGGVALDRVLFYATAGIASQDVDFTFGDRTDPTSANAASVSNLGLTYGAGMELSMTELVSLRAEYLVVDSQSEEIADFGGDTGDFHASSTSLNFGVNFRF